MTLIFVRRKLLLLKAVYLLQIKLIHTLRFTLKGHEKCYMGKEHSEQQQQKWYMLQLQPKEA